MMKDYVDVLDQYLYYTPSIDSNATKPAFFDTKMQRSYFTHDNENEVLYTHGAETENNGKNNLPTFNIKR
jgi:hypothetical protein